MIGNNTETQLSIAGRTSLAGLGFCALLWAAMPAEAQTRRQPDTTQLTCAQTHDLIRRFGGINLKTGPHKFDRYVVSRNHCFAGQAVRTTHVPTTDSPRCSVQVCVEPSQNNR
ncbi:hypothetical protein [Roseibium sp. M-1]